MAEMLVATYPNEFEARLLADRLRGEGIHSMVKPMGPGYGLAGPVSFIPHSVYVMDHQYEDAARVAAAGEVIGSEGLPENSSH